MVASVVSGATLGIYSAWAKVRRLRYFYGHTSVDGGALSASILEECLALGGGDE